MTSVVSGISNQLLPVTFHESLDETDDEFVVAEPKPSFLQNEAQTQELFDKLVRLVDDAARGFIRKIEGCSYKTTREPEELAAQFGEILNKIHCYTQGLKRLEEGQGLFQLVCSRLGFGGKHPSQRQLNELDTLLKASWRGYLKRCQAEADEMQFDGHEMLALKMYRRLETIACRNGQILERLGDLYLQIGQQEKAIGYFDKLLSRKIRPISCSYKKAHCLLHVGRSTEAFEVLDRLSQKNEVMAVIKKELFLKGIETKIKLGMYLEAISDANIAIEKYPEVDQFRRYLIDAYLAYSIRDNGELFRKSFPQLSQCFSQQSCYSVVRRSYGDSLQVMFDLFDYSARSSSFAFSLYQDSICFTESSTDESSTEFLELCYDNVLCRLESLEKRKATLQKERAQLCEKVKVHTFDDEDETEVLRSKLLFLPEEFVGGRHSFIKIGYIRYIDFYKAVILRLKEKVKEPQWMQKIEQLDARAKMLKGQFSQLYSDSSELRGLFSTREQIAKRAKNIKEPEEEVSAVGLIKQGNLMNFIKDTFVPKEERDEFVKYLESQGLNLEKLFRSDLMSAVCGTQVLQIAQMTDLQSYIRERTIKTIDDLKKLSTK